jgi:hypothetical protein
MACLSTYGFDEGDGNMFGDVLLHVLNVQDQLDSLYIIPANCVILQNETDIMRFMKSTSGLLSMSRDRSSLVMTYIG